MRPAFYRMLFDARRTPFGPERLHKYSLAVRKYHHDPFVMLLLGDDLPDGIVEVMHVYPGILAWLRRWLRFLPETLPYRGIKRVVCSVGSVLAIGTALYTGVLLSVVQAGGRPRRSAARLAVRPA